MTNHENVSDNLISDNFAAERAAIARERAELEIQKLTAAGDAAFNMRDLADPINVEAEEAVAPKVVPPGYSRMVVEGEEFFAKVPGDGALIAITMVGTSGLQSDAQLRVLGNFFAKHLEPESYELALSRMSDPDSSIGVAELMNGIVALAAKGKPTNENVNHLRTA